MFNAFSQNPTHVTWPTCPGSDEIQKYMYTHIPKRDLAPGGGGLGSAQEVGVGSAQEVGVGSAQKGWYMLFAVCDMCMGIY